MKKVKYVYYEKDKKTHILGKSKLIETEKWIVKGVKVKPVEKVKLVDARNISSYLSGNVKFKILKWNTSKEKRYFISIDCFAGLIGAMVEESIQDLCFNGFSDIDGKPGGSSTHLNGVAGDLRYLSINKDASVQLLGYTTFDYERQVKFNNALYKFGWGRTQKMLSENFNRKVKKEVINPKTKKKEIKEVSEKTLLPHTKHKKFKKKNGVWVRHNNHLHIYGFQYSLIKTKS
ncbi:hypothetical protein [Tenacibaculum ovolyticum]|uniref:hypothetical protein n=1 Tax=Tenacibaculum ovolyticum TaxID=104270 RepID=UPI003BAC6AB8